MSNKEPQVFTMIRHRDCNGVSGTGRVLDGVIFPNGKVVVCWRPEISSIQVYDSFECFLRIHVDPHPDNRAEIVWSEEGLEGNPKVC